MAKHKLFIEAENSPQFGSSLDESRGSEKKKQRRTSTMNSKPDTTKTSTPIRKRMRQVEKQTPARLEEDAVVNSPPTVNKKCVATQAGFLTFEKDSDSDSNSDSMSVQGFFSVINQKLPYSYEEDEEIIRHVLKGQGIFKVTSILLWKHLEYQKQNPRRTYQSLKNRFLRNIKPHLLTTYRHLIPDEETLQKILIKFPELKKQVRRKETLSRIKLPERNTALKVLMDGISSTSARERSTNFENLEATDRCLPSPAITSTPSTSQLSNDLNFRRKVELNGESLTVLVNLNFKQPSPKSTRIYEKYWNLKLRNKLVPCSACGRCFGPEELPDSGAESDAFISNSVESKKSEGSSPKKKLILRKNKSFQSQKRKKKNLIPESCNSQRSCSPSLLIDVDEVDELDENQTKDAESKSETARPDDISNSEIQVREADSTPAEPSPVVNVDTDTIYQNTVAEFRMLIDSDEEEVLVKRCLRKNRKTIGFDANLSVEDIHVDSYFVKSNSPGLESAAASDSSAGCASSRNRTQISSGRSLAQNMMNMLGNAKFEETDFSKHKSSK